jgi:hypothetical protein
MFTLAGLRSSGLCAAFGGRTLRYSGSTRPVRRARACTLARACSSSLPTTCSGPSGSGFTAQLASCSCRICKPAGVPASTGTDVINKDGAENDFHIMSGQFAFGGDYPANKGRHVQVIPAQFG